MGNRSHGEASLLRPQQILFCRELGFRLREIGEILGRPGFNRMALRERTTRLEILLAAVDKILLHLKGTRTMGNEELLEGFNAARQEEHG